MTDSAKGYAPILAAGGIVLRGEARPRIAVVRMRREKAWVLPKGKLLPRERAHIAAKREVLEETGYETSVHEFLGSMSYMAEGRLKIVQFWLMRVVGQPTHELMGDVKAVKFLPLKKAIETLTRPHEKVFLTHVGPIALRHAKKFGGKSRRTARSGGKRGRTSPPSPVEHVIALDYGKTSPNTVKALGNWVGRARHLARLAG
ncbi:MAG: NUDIX domain-containing protein [Xanthobacteraceae bacterium]